jgi:hypothetical protein
MNGAEIMDETRAVAIVSALADGVNPLTGEIFPVDSPLPGGGCGSRVITGRARTRKSRRSETVRRIA